MPTVVLLRHGRTTANASGILAGRASGVHLDDTGKSQADAAAQRLAPVQLRAVYTSPMVRCRETVAPVLVGRELQATRHAGLNECDYGSWQGSELRALAKDKLWPAIQSFPSSVRFPQGESLSEMSARVAGAVRSLDAAVAAEHGAEAVWLAVSHGDPIKAVIADALGLHLDNFQRINVDPASISVIHYGSHRATVLAVNTHAGELGWLNPAPRTKRSRSRQTLGGGAGPAAP